MRRIFVQLLTLYFQWGARRREDYESLYIKISGSQLSIDMEDGNKLVIVSDGSLTLHQPDGTIHDDIKAIDKYLKR